MGALNFTSRFRLMLAAFGIVCLGCVIYWLYRHSGELRTIPTKALAYGLCAGLGLVFFNSKVLQISIASLGFTIRGRDALLLTAIGSIANSLGGLPIGTGVRFGILVRKYGMSPGQVFWAYAFYSIVNVIFVAIVAAVTSFIVHGYGYFSTAVLPITIVMAICLLAWKIRIKVFYVLPATVRTIITSPRLPKGIMASGMSVTMMFSCYAALVLHDSSWIDIVKLMLVVSAALLVGFLSGFPALGGVQELLVGGGSALLNMPFTVGMQLALSVRLLSLLASGVWLLYATVSLWSEGRPQYFK